LGYVDRALVDRCLRGRLCGVCGLPVPGKMVFLMRERDPIRKFSNEPGRCPPCAAYTLRVCPMVGGFMQRYGNSVNPFVTRRCGDGLCPCRQWSAPAGPAARLGAPAEPWYALWTMRYRLGHDPEGRLAAGFAGLRVLALKEVPSRPGPDAGRQAGTS